MEGEEVKEQVDGLMWGGKPIFDEDTEEMLTT
jgi:hypothetical protein